MSLENDLDFLVQWSSNRNGQIDLWQVCDPGFVPSTETAMTCQYLTSGSMKWSMEQKDLLCVRACHLIVGGMQKARLIIKLFFINQSRLKHVLANFMARQVQLIISFMNTTPLRHLWTSPEHKRSFSLSSLVCDVVFHIFI